MYILSLTSLSTAALLHSKPASRGQLVTAAVSKNTTKKKGVSLYLEINLTWKYRNISRYETIKTKEFQPDLDPNCKSFYCDQGIALSSYLFVF